MNIFDTCLLRGITHEEIFENILRWMIVLVYILKEFLKYNGYFIYK